MVRRWFAETCLERSHLVALDVAVNVSEWGWTQPGYTCGQDIRERLLPNEESPCDCHFVFESLATPVHSRRVHTLNIDLDSSDDPSPRRKGSELVLGSCRFFTLSFPRLTSFGWDGSDKYTYHIFSNSPFTSTVRSLSFEGSWDGPLTLVNNLASFSFVNCEDVICIETFRLFVSNNRSIESLAFEINPFKGNTTSSSIDLLNLKSFSVTFCPGAYGQSSVPPPPKASSLQTSFEGVDAPKELKLLSAGDGITLSVVALLCNIAEV